METAFDNCNNADLNNPVQNIIQNANTEFKTEKSSDIFKTDNPFNDGMNNFVQIGDTNSMHTNLDSPGEMQKGDLPECEQIYQYGEEILGSKVIDKRPFDGDLGPETSVDVPDDVIMNTESSEENLSKSSLSHSKEVLPLSDNLNPFDAKNSLTDLETNEFQMQDDTKTCTTPSENLLDTPVDTVSLDDAKQVSPSDFMQTNGIHSEEHRFAEDLVHDELPISNEFIKDNKHETAYLNAFESEVKLPEDFINNFIDDNTKKDFDDAVQNNPEVSVDREELIFMEHGKIEEQHIIGSLDDNKHVEQDISPMNIPEVSAGREETAFMEHVKTEDQHIIQSFDDNKLIEQDFASEKEIIKDFEDEKDVRSPTDATCDGNILELHASGSLLQDIEHETSSSDQCEHKEHIVQESEKETLNDHLEINSPEYTINIGEAVNENENELIEKFDEISFDEKNSGIDDGGVHIPPIQLDSSNALQEVDEQTLPIEEAVQQIQEELISETQQKEDIELEQDQLLNIQQEQISQLQQDISQIRQDQFVHEIKDESGRDVIGEMKTNETLNAEKDIMNDFRESVKEEPEFIKAEKIEENAEAAILEMDVIKEVAETEIISQHTALESCEESEDEWNYMRLKGEGEKEISKAETEELASPAETKSIPEDLSITELQGEVGSQEPTITSVEESKDNISTPSVEPSADTLEISEAQLDNLDKEVADMSSQLNPEAKEFIPTSMSPVHFELTNGIPPIAAARHIAADDVVAQSPRKGLYSMEDIEIPSETEFKKDIVHCPSEIQTSPEQNDLYQEMNLKEAMHGSEKEEQVCEEGYEYNMPTDLDNVGMKESIYIESSFDKEQDFMNTVQPLPVEIDEIKDTSMEIPVVPDTSLNEISVDNKSDLNQLLDMEAVNQVIQQQTSPEELISQITKTVDLLELSESPVQQEVVKAENILSAEISQKEVSEPVTCVQVEHIASIPVESTTPVQNEPKIPDLPAETIESIVEITEEKEKIESLVADKVVATKPSIKVPDAKKDLKAKVSSISSAPKKVSSSTSTASTDTSKPKTSHAISKTKATTAAAAPRPRTVPLASKTVTEKKTTAPNLAAARPKVDARSTLTTAAKKPTTAAPKTKPDEQTKVGVKQSVSKTGVTSKPPITSRTSSSTSTTSKTRATAPTTNTTTTKTTGQRVALSAPAKSASTTKPATSPRGTLTSTLRKTEALKSPTGTTKVTATKTTTSTLTTTRTSSTTKQTKPLTPTAKTSTTTTNLSANAKKQIPSPRPALSQKKTTPIKKTSISPVKKVAVENKKNQELNEAKLNGTAVEAAEKADSKQ